jgi:chaperonin GroEL
VIKVGAATESEVHERRLRVDDAVLATRAALKEGIVAGGGSALLRAQEAIDTSGLSGDEVTGAEILRAALDQPLRLIASNSGFEGSLALERVRAMGPRDGLNSATGEFCDLIDAGVLDPAMVVRSTLQNAASIAKNVLTTECLISWPPQPPEPPEEELQPMDPTGGGMMDPTPGDVG